MDISTHVTSLRQHTLAFVASCQYPAAGVGRWRYASDCTAPTLYSSCYAAMTQALYGELDALGDTERLAWMETLNHHQDGDGLYRDPLIFDQGWYAGDPLWCGRPYLTCHIITALACLGGVAARPLAWLDPWRDLDRLSRWLETRDWGERVGWTGNEIMNVGTLLQYARDFHHDDRAGRSVAVLLEWLAAHHLNSNTGVWGDVDVSDPLWRSHAVQAAYHWWPLFFYDGAPIPHIERAIDTLLATLNPTSAPRSVAPRTGCARTRCRMAGSCSSRIAPSSTGTLTLALIGKALPDHPLGAIPWRFVRCPGMQFWNAA
ncbi:MAG: hypothetical protein M1546_15425 [Chloroflexi bacterium]|nr:hypothetical protein [Chloroflexota bacterium]